MSHYQWERDRKPTWGEARERVCVIDRIVEREQIMLER
jgi:hypothetical protein